MKTSSAFTWPSKKLSTRLAFTRKLPRPQSFGPQALLIYDSILTRKVPGFSAWAAKFSARYQVRAGESLKNARDLARHLEKIIPLVEGFSRSRMTIVAVGGGSVGDFAGFVASVYRRGVDLVHVPSTWLSAIDSAHGGKTALNVGGIKNAIGTFYPASKVHLVEALLRAQGPRLAEDALAELVKIALIDGGAWTKSFVRSPLSGGDLVWKYLRPAVEAKYKVVKADPFEALQVRERLNLGHSLGHVAESYFGLSHGEAVARGLEFACRWSAHRGLLAPRHEPRVEAILARLPARAKLGAIPRTEFLRRLRGDKKSLSKSKLRFIFVERPGHVRGREVSMNEICLEATRQAWLKSSL